MGTKTANNEEAKEEESGMAIVNQFQGPTGRVTVDEDDVARQSLTHWWADAKLDVLIDGLTWAQEDTRQKKNVASQQRDYD